MPALMKSIIMKPSERFRKFSLFFSSKNVIQKPFMYSGVVIMIGSLIFLLFNRGKQLSVHSTVNGVSSIKYVSGYFIFLYVFLFGLLFFAIGKYFIEFIYRSVNKSRKQYPVSYDPLSKEELLQDVLTLNEEQDQFDIKVNGDWIDITWNYFGSLFANFQGIEHRKTIYYKLILIHDDYTYEDLDYEVTGDIDFSLRHISLSKSVSCGHIYHRVYAHNIDGSVIKFSSDDINDYIDEYLASKGYSRRG